MEILEQTPPKPKKQRRSSKPEAVKAAVIAKAAIGESNAQIANDLDIDRATVRNILSSTEVASVIQQGKSDAIRMIPDAIRTFQHHLRANNAKVATSVLNGTGVLSSDSGSKGNTQVNILIERGTFYSPTQNGSIQPAGRIDNLRSDAKAD
jgi:hypothetical protein